MRRLAAVLLLTLGLLTSAHARDETRLAAGRRFTAMFYAGELERLWEHLSESQRAELGSIANLSHFRDIVRDLIGDELRVVREDVTAADGQSIYVRRVRYAKSAELFDVKWTIDAQGRIADFSIRPSLPATELVYRSKTRLRLPFDGDWVVGSGGRTPVQNANHHYDYMSRFDCDFVRVEDARFDKNANPPTNEEFAGFGRPILAPGAGRVARVRDGIPDNVPGRINERREERAGNFVVIDHGNGEYSLLAHLRNGSVQVRVGERVKVGQKVGECGNSGNSSGPHLHYGLRGTSVPDAGMSLPAQFQSYSADGKLIRRGEPVRGQKIRHAER